MPENYNMKYYILLLLPVLITAGGQAQKIFTPFSKAYTGFSACSRSFPDAFSFTANQAALAGVKVAAVGLYSEKLWLLEELNRYSGVAAIPLKNAGIGITADYAGDRFFRQWQAGLAYGKKLAENLDIGIQFTANQVSIAGYGSLVYFNAEIGALLHFTDKLHASLHIANLGLTGPRKNAAEQPAAVYSMGIGYEASEKLFIKLEMAKEEDQPARMITGIQYHISKQAFLRAGLVTGGSLFAGAGLSWKNMRTDITASFHPQLGITPGILLILHASK